MIFNTGITIILRYTISLLVVLLFLWIFSYVYQWYRQKKNSGSNTLKELRKLSLLISKMNKEKSKYKQRDKIIK